MTEYSRCVKCGQRRPQNQLVQYKLRSYCKDNTTQTSPSCYMAEFLKDLETLKHSEKFK